MHEPAAFGAPFGAPFGRAAPALSRRLSSDADYFQLIDDLIDEDVSPGQLLGAWDDLILLTF